MTKKPKLVKVPEPKIPATAQQWLEEYAVTLEREAGDAKLHAAELEIKGKLEAAEMRGRGIAAQIIGRKLQAIAAEYKKRGKG